MTGRLGRVRGAGLPGAGLLGAALLAAVVPAAGAQGLPTCRVPTGSNEAKLLAFYAAPFAFSPVVRPAVRPAGTVVLSGELTYVPSPSTELQQSRTCYTEKSETTELSPVLPRPRLLVALPGGLAIEASYLPPVTVADATPNVASAALSWTRALGAPSAGARLLALQLRAHGTYGYVTGAITCSRDAIQLTDEGRVCFARQPSKDTYRPTTVGGEAALSVLSAGGRLGAYAGSGVSVLSPHFRVGFESARPRAPYDDTPVEPDGVLVRVPLFAAVTYRVAAPVELSAQLYAVAGDLATGRVGLSYQLR